MCFTATSVVAERVFSRGRILLSHIRNCLSAQTTHTLMCLGDWSRHGLVKDSDVTAVAMMPNVPADDGSLDWEVDLEDGWDAITLYNTVALPPEHLKFIILVTYAYLSFLYAVLAWKIFIIVQVFVLSCKAQSLCLG